MGLMLLIMSFESEIKNFDFEKGKKSTPSKRNNASQKRAPLYSLDQKKSTNVQRRKRAIHKGRPSNESEVGMSVESGVDDEMNLRHGGQRKRKARMKSGSGSSRNNSNYGISIRQGRASTRKPSYVEVEEDDE